jgi:hypothetical protein
MELSKTAMTKAETAAWLRLARSGYHRGDEKNHKESYDLAHATPNDRASVNRG